MKAGEILETFESSDPSQAGKKAWVALDIDTGMDDIRKVKYNGTLLTDKDVADATSVGLPAGHTVLWIDYNAVSKKPKTFTLSAETESKTITVYCA